MGSQSTKGKNKGKGNKRPERPPSSYKGNTSSPEGHGTGVTAGRNNGMEGSLGRDGDNSGRRNVSRNPYQRRRSVSGTRQTHHREVQQTHPVTQQEQEELLLRELDDVDDDEYVDLDDTVEGTQVAPPPAQGSDQIILCGLYWDGTKKEELPDEFIRLLEHAPENNIPLIIRRDFNAHSEVWGPKKTTHSG